MSAPLLGTVVALLLSVIAPIILLDATATQGGENSYLGPLVIACGAGLRFAAIVGSRRRRLFEMVFWLFVYVFLGIAPTIQLRLGIDTDTTPNISHSFDGQATAIVIAGCVAFLFGAFLGKEPKQGAPASEVPAVGSLVSPARVNVLTIACLGLFAYYVSRLGLSNLFISRSAFDLLRSEVWADKTTNVLIVGATSMGLLVATVGQIYLRQQRKGEGRSRPFMLPLASLVSLLLCVNPISSPRYIFGTVLLALLGACGAYATANRFRLVSLGAVFGLVYLFPIADMFRRSLDPAAKSQNPLESMLSGDFDSFAQITNTAEYVATEGITWGNQLLGVLFFWLPRSVWPDKAVDTGTMLGEWKLYMFKNLSAPLWAELFINGGWLILVVGMLILGAAVAKLDRSSEAALATTGRPTVLACILPFYMLIVLRGSLLQSVAFMTVVVLAYLFIRTKFNAKVEARSIAPGLNLAPTPQPWGSQRR